MKSQSVRPTRRVVLSVLLILAAWAIRAQVFTLSSVPNPKDQGSGYVSDPSGILSTQTRAAVNRLLAELEANSTAQVAVVMLPSIGSQVPKVFATDLFQEWGIGQADVDNGLLILTVMDQRRTEFETGYGLEGVLPDVVCFRIGTEEIVPRFQQGDFDGGILAAVQRVKTILEDSDAAEEIRSSGSEWKSPLELWWVWVLILGYLGINLATHWHIIGRIQEVLHSRETLYDKYLDLRKLNWWGLIFVFPLPFIFLFIYIRRRLHQLRYQPRYSPNSGAPMHLLSEPEDDQYLKKGQVTEEQLRSADYDVWVTEDGEDLLVLRYANYLSGYAKCPSCGYQAYKIDYTKTIIKATRTSTGKQKQVYKCKNCHYAKTKYKTIPKVSASSGGSSGGFSGGSSFGGGSSGGGGAGVSW